jgi:hypothetical protein
MGQLFQTQSGSLQLLKQLYDTEDKIVLLAFNSTGSIVLANKRTGEANSYFVADVQ